jgi:hypothetical protein
MTSENQWNELSPYAESEASLSIAESDSVLKKPLGDRILAKKRTSFLRFARVQIVAAVVGTLVCGISGWVGWATNAIHPLPKTQLMLVGTDYHDNLLIAPNLTGDRCLGRLAEFIDSHRDEDDFRISSTQVPQDFLDTSSIDAALSARGDQPAILYVTAHGLSSPSGPVLLTRNATSFKETIAVRTILDRFAGMPAAIPKALILDVCHVDVDRHWGILHNDFVYQLRSLNPEIAAIPNLCVIVDCDIDQQGWANPISGTTVFGNFFLDGLRGYAPDINNDGWLDLSDIFAHCQSQTQLWVSQHLQRVQQPLLLPLGDIGRDRCRQHALRKTTKLPLAAPSSMAQRTRPDLVDQWWQTHAQLKNRTPHPALTTPLVWDRFVAALVRFEHFEMHGSRAAADWLDAQLQDLQNQLDRGRAVPSAASRAGIIAPNAVGSIAPRQLNQSIIDVAIELNTLDGRARDEAWQQAVASCESHHCVALVRRGVTSATALHLAEQLAAQDFDRIRLDRSADLIRTTLDPLQTESTLATLILLLQRDLPGDFTSPNDRLRLARLLRLWINSDTVAPISESEAHYLDPELLPWVQTLVETADTQRRIAFDLLMGDQAIRSSADSYIEKAETLSDQIGCITRTINEAETSLRIGWNQLAWHASAIESMATLAPNQTVSMVEALERAYDAAEALEDLLAKPIDTNDPKGNICATLQSSSAAFAHSVDDLHDPLVTWYAEQYQSQQLAVLMNVTSLPGHDGTRRRALWKRCRDIAASAVTSDNKSSAKRDTRQVASLLGRVALAPWTGKTFDSIGSPGDKTFQQLQHQLDVFAVEPGWRDSLITIGHEVFDRYDTVRQHLAAPKPSSFSTASANAIARRFDGLLPPAACRAIDAQRQQTVARYLLFAAQRTIRDNLASSDNHSIPYFERAAKLLVDDASRFLDAQQTTPLNQDLAAALSLNITTETQLDWTTQQTRTLTVDVSRSGSPEPGYVTLSMSASAPLAFVYPESGKRVTWPIQANTESGPTQQSDPIKQALIQIELQDDSLDSQPNLHSKLEICGYFRGRVLRSSVAVNIHRSPTIHVTNPPISRAPRVAIRGLDRDTGDRFRGAVALVIDCSGSMGAKPGAPFDSSTKYAQAIHAIESLLRDIPSGTRLSVWTFGQAGKHSKTTQPAEMSIQRILPLTVWDSGSELQHDQLIHALSYPQMEPWNESPLVASILAASAELEQCDEPFRTIIAITDGYDNRIESDPIHNPDHKSLDDVLRDSLSKSGIVLNVIGFRVDASDKEKTRDSLQIVERFIPAGKFVLIEGVEDLKHALRNAMKSPLEYAINAVGENLADRIKAKCIESPSSGALNWNSETLQPGIYQIQPMSIVDRRTGVPTTIELSAGDSLVLRRDSEGHLQLDDHFEERSAVYTGEIDQYAIQVYNEQSPNIGSQRFTISLVGSNPSPLEIKPPGDIWFEIRDTDGGLIPMTWKRMIETPGLVYQIDAALPRGHVGPVQAIVYVNRATSPPQVRLLKERDFRSFDDLAPVLWEDATGILSLDDARIERWDVVNETGEVVNQPCLVVRMHGPAGSRFRIRPVGLTIAGYDEQLFDESGAYTYRAWPITKDIVQSDLQAIELYTAPLTTTNDLRGSRVLTFPIHLSGSNAIALIP